MPKIYRLTESQLKMLSEQVKKQKVVTENLMHNQVDDAELDGLSPEAQQYYKANPQAWSEKKQKDAEEQKLKAEDQNPMQDPEFQQLHQQMQTWFQKNNVDPVQWAQGLAGQTPKDASGNAVTPQNVAQEPTQDQGKATQAPTPPQGPQPAPTGDETEQHSGDATPSSTADIQASQALAENSQKKSEADFSTPIAVCEHLGVPSKELAGISGGVLVHWSFAPVADEEGIQGISTDILGAEFTDGTLNEGNSSGSAKLNVTDLGIKIQNDINLSSLPIKPIYAEMNWGRMTLRVWN